MKTIGNGTPSPIIIEQSQVNISPKISNQKSKIPKIIGNDGISVHIDISSIGTLNPLYSKAIPITINEIVKEGPSRTAIPQ